MVTKLLTKFNEFYDINLITNKFHPHLYNFNQIKKRTGIFLILML